MWRVVERRLGRAGGGRERAARQREWDRRHGPDNWAVGYVIDGEFVPQDAAVESVYFASYAAHFDRHPADLAELIATAKALRNPHAQATTGVDLQLLGIHAYLDRHNLTLAGAEVVDVGTWNGERSHALSVRLSPLHVRCVFDSKRTLEAWWQAEKCLAVWAAG